MTTVDGSTVDGSTLDDVRLARVALSALLEPGSRALYQLISGAGPVGALEALTRGEVEKELAGAAASRLAGGDPRRLAEHLYARAVRVGARLVTPEDEQWPTQLADLRLIGREGAGRIERDTFPPVCLWVRGDWPVADVLAKSVAVVGSRAATSYGTHLATELGYGLANRGWAVVSGGAFGVDAAAHRGALAGGGVTVAVLACGVDRAYPAGNASLLDRISEDGLLISEWPPG
ncbi:MAG: DNA-processing protein DprA, partial [Micromonosporaceae bacterium]|nr:DNA-processing protein DprA [Micromonosporaceae bacterium]